MLTNFCYFCSNNLTWRDIQHLIAWSSEYSPLRWAICTTIRITYICNCIKAPPRLNKSRFSHVIQVKCVGKKFPRAAFKNNSQCAIDHDWQARSRRTKKPRDNGRWFYLFNFSLYQFSFQKIYFWYLNDIRHIYLLYFLWRRKNT